MRALVTGADGFVGKYLIAALKERSYDITAAGGPNAADGMLRIDVRDMETLRRALDVSDPDVVFHLAGQPFVPRAIEKPLEAFDINALGTVRMLEAIRTSGRTRQTFPRFVLAGSASVYGRVSESNNPLREDHPIEPVDPYGASKAAAACFASAAWCSYGIPVVIARSFNHIGRGQSTDFVVPSFAAQLARIKAGAEKPVMYVGDLTTERDFLDVRDVVEAYIALAENGDPGEVYNVCSGVPMRIQDILRLLIQIADIPIEVREDPARMRRSDVRTFYGDNAKLCALGWAPKIPLGRSLREIFEDALAHQLETSRT
jgi:GDP-4-dehydro-6-deoxy-D-mannose reductase